jgi:hypothetical protein
MNKKSAFTNKAIRLKVGNLLLSTIAITIRLDTTGEGERPWGYITKIAKHRSGNAVTVVWTHDVANSHNWFETDLEYSISNGSIILYE